MLTIISIICLIVSLVIFVGDFIILKKTKSDKNDLTGLKEWCQSTGKNPDDFLKILYSIKSEVNK